MEKQALAFDDLFEKPDRKTCKTCQGSGECFQCARSGLWYAGTWQEETCTSCNGSGGCRICSGCSQGEAFVRSAMRRALGAGLSTRELKAQTEEAEMRTAIVALCLARNAPVETAWVQRAAAHYSDLAANGLLGAVLAYQAIRDFRDFDRSEERAGQERERGARFYTEHSHPEIAACFDVIGGLIRCCHGQVGWGRDIADQRVGAMQKLGEPDFAKAFKALAAEMGLR